MIVTVLIVLSEPATVQIHTSSTPRGSPSRRKKRLKSDPQPHHTHRRSESTPAFPSNAPLKDTSRLPPNASNSGPYSAPVAGSSAAPFPTSKEAPVLFYEKDAPFYEFTNFSPHDVVYKGKRYPTSEHLFQSFKFMDEHPEIAEKIRTCGERPMSAFDEAHRYQKRVRSDWRQVHTQKMEIALRLKFTQHADLKALLLGTGDADLVEDSPRDYFWGIGADGSGRNELGKALMRLREELTQELDNPSHVPTTHRRPSRLSFQDFPSASGTASGSRPRKRSSASPHAGGLCAYCGVKPRYENHRYCGRTCALEASKMCSFCHSKPRSGKHPFCSTTCATKAGGKG